MLILAGRRAVRIAPLAIQYLSRVAALLQQVLCADPRNVCRSVGLSKGWRHLSSFRDFARHSVKRAVGRWSIAVSDPPDQALELGAQAAELGLSGIACVQT